MPHYELHYSFNNKITIWHFIGIGCYLSLQNECEIFHNKNEVQKKMAGETEALNSRSWFVNLYVLSVFIGGEIARELATVSTQLKEFFNAVFQCSYRTSRWLSVNLGRNLSIVRSTVPCAFHTSTPLAIPASTEK